MKRAVAIALMLATATLAHASPATAAFGFSDLDVSFTQADGSSANQAGSHPFAMATKLGINIATVSEGGVCTNPLCEVPEGETKNLTVELPPGFAGNPFAVPRCSSEDFAQLDLESFNADCPNASAVGLVGVRAEFSPLPAGTGEFVYFPVYNLEPPPGVAAKLGFYVLGVPVTVESGVSEEPPFALRAMLTEISQALLFYGSELILWGNPAAAEHDPYRGNCVDSRAFGGIVSLGKCPVDIPEVPFLTLPRSCQGPLSTRFVADSWQNPGTFVEGTAVTHDSSDPPTPQGMAGCSKLGFGPKTEAQLTSASAESPSGIEFAVTMHDEGLNSPSGLAQSDIRKIVVALPSGITANPSAAEGLGVCTRSQFEAAKLTVRGCPEASKLGSVSVQTPILENHTLHGSVYLAQQDDPGTLQPGSENPFDSLLALYVLIRDPQLGIFVSQPVKVEPDPASGQLVATVADLPQFPLSSIEMQLREGPRAPLVTPPACGTYTTRAEITPWSGSATVTSTSTFGVSSGPNGGPCPSGLPFSPGFEAGTVNNNAGSHSPLLMRLTRKDGDQDLTKFSATLPPGLVAKLAGTTQCADIAIDTAKGKSGKAERAVPSCPASSRLGSILAGAGVGPALTYVPGALYLAGPFHGAPLSVAAIVPAVAGPFDVGTVVTRVALRVDPRSAQVSVDGSASDPIPHILAGLPLKVRDIRVAADRPQFSLNPTSCDPFEIGAEIWGGGANVFSSLDDSPVRASQRFQAASCAQLDFRPTLSLRLKGATARGGNPALTAIYRPRSGDANLRSVFLRLPRSAFLDQGHIRTICTKVQFAADACPAGAVYGHVEATSPLLDDSLEGAAYLLSSNHELPDLVFDLRGTIDVEAVARIASSRGGITASFTDLPDAPLTTVVVQMQGAKKGLIENSADLCHGKRRARGRFIAHNAKLRHMRPLMAVTCKANQARFRSRPIARR